MTSGSVSILRKTGQVGRFGCRPTGLLCLSVLATLTLLPVTSAGEPPIPQLNMWEQNMVRYGAMHIDERHKKLDNSGVWYYDGIRVFHNIAAYTKDSKWYKASENCREVYRPYCLTKKVNGWEVFPVGLSMDFKRTKDPLSRDAVMRLAHNSAYASKGGGTPQEESRETAYMLMTYLVAEELGDRPTQLRDRAVQCALGHMDQWFVSKNAKYMQPYMVGLTAEALIMYHERTKDPRVVKAVQAAADWLWLNAWIPQQRSFWYITPAGVSPYDPTRTPKKGAPDLNMLIAPIYAWVYMQTGETKYRDAGDQAFVGGIQGAMLSGGKQFSQTYHWSFEYVKWRQLGPKGKSGSATSGNTGSISPPPGY